jgi:hypothetical protein
MTTSTWTIAGKSGSHTVCLDHSYWSATATLWVDQSIVFCGPRKIRTPGFSHEFSVDGVDCLVRIDVAPSLSFKHLLLNRALENAALVIFECPHCGNHVSFQEKKDSKARECPTCFQPLVVPKQEEEMGLALQPKITRHHRISLFVRSVRLLCLIAAIWIGYDNNWAGPAWIPIAVLLILAIAGNLVGYTCAFLVHLMLVFHMYRIAYELSRMSPATRERYLSQMNPDSREHFLSWVKKT